MYEQNNALNSGHFTQSELHLYGSSRLGIYNLNKDLTLTPPVATNLGSGNSGGFGIFERNKKFFELTNHLGNVLATVSDEKIGVSINGNTIDYYTANVVSAGDYYPFGQSMPGRTYNNLPRYTFNGKEYDKETGYQDYGMRMYNITGRFISVDPLTKKYPELTPYQYASNNPIQNTDLDGLEGIARNLKTGEVAKGPLDPNRFPASDGWITNMPKLSNPVFTATFKMVAKEREIMMNNGLGTNYIGPESIVLDNIAIDRRNYSNAVLDNIRGGLGGTVGYWVGGERGSFYGAAVDGIAMSFGGIPGESSVFPKASRVNSKATEPAQLAPYVSPLNLSINLKSGWTESQVTEAYAKAQELTSDPGTMVKLKNPATRPSNLRSTFKKNGGIIMKGQDLDHRRELQLNGNNAHSNLIGRDQSVNRSFGPQIYQQIKNVPDNTRVNTVSINPFIKNE